MSYRKSLKQLTIALGFAALSSLFATSIGSAQTVTPPASDPRVRIETPASGARVHGAVTFTGTAVDCATGQAASNVSVYEGSNSSGNYLADVSMDTNRTLSEVCGTGNGSPRIGFTLIFDSNRLSDGRHTLAFVARYPNGLLQTSTIDVNVDNVPNQPAVRYPANYTGVYQGGYWVNNVYTPVYTRCTAWNLFGNCTAYANVAAPVVTPAVYPGCVTNVYGQCVSYPYTSNPYYANTYLSNLYYWNGFTWVLR
jgi:hypothetical protein